MDILVTRRLTLRPPLEVDADAIFEGLSNFNVSRNLKMVPYPYGEKDAQKWIEDSCNVPCRFTIHRERLIGTIGVRPANGPDGYPILGYWLAEPYWGNGYATEAARATIAHAFRHFGTDAMDSYAEQNNSGSLAVMDKLGFERIGTQDDFLLARNEHTVSICTRLKRSTFERMFGSLETDQAA